MILSSRGFLSRIFRPLFQLVTESWHMFLPGFLFGLGFDTATEVAMFGVAATQATKGISLGAILTLPACAAALFAAGACNRQVRARNGPGAEVLSHAFTKAVEWGYVRAHPFKNEVRLEGEAPRERYIEDWEVVEVLSLPSVRKRGSSWRSSPTSG